MTIEMVPAPTDVELILAIDHSRKLHDCTPVVVVMRIVVACANFSSSSSSSVRDRPFWITRTIRLSRGCCHAHRLDHFIESFEHENGFAVIVRVAAGT